MQLMHTHIRPEATIRCRPGKPRDHHQSRRAPHAPCASGLQQPHVLRAVRIADCARPAPASRSSCVSVGPPLPLSRFAGAVTACWLQRHSMSSPLVVRSSASATDRIAVELPPFSMVCANQTMCLFGLEVSPNQLHSVLLGDASPLKCSLYDPTWATAHIEDCAWRGFCSPTACRFATARRLSTLRSA